MSEQKSLDTETFDRENITAEGEFYQRQLESDCEINSAHRLLVRGAAIILAVAFIGTAVLIYIGETTLWASPQTVSHSVNQPSIEIIP